MDPLAEIYAELFQKFRLDEPWDSPHNSQLLEYMPDTYNIEGARAPKYSTFYRVLVNSGGCFEPDFRSVNLRDIKDGPRNTMSRIFRDSFRSMMVERLT